MNKFSKIALTIASVALIGGAVAFAGCDSDNSKTYEGTYQYTNYGNNYGIKVKVTLNGEKITKVEKVDSDLVEVSAANPDYGWTQDKVDVWTNGLEGLLKAYEGKTAEEVIQAAADCTLSATVAGQIDKVENANYNIAGATQGSGRLLFAVVDALKGAGYNYGSYSYESYGHTYGIEVLVKTEGDKISYVKALNTTFVTVSAANPDYGWTQDKVDNWNNGLADLLKVYEGKTVEEVKAIKVEVNEAGVPNTVDKTDYVIAGATQGSGRLVLAVQNALK